MINDGISVTGLACSGYECADYEIKRFSNRQTILQINDLAKLSKYPLYEMYKLCDKLICRQIQIKLSYEDVLCCMLITG